MRLFRTTAENLNEEADALERAADMALVAGDHEHKERLREAALFKRRCAREKAAGFNGWPVMAFDKV